MRNRSSTFTFYILAFHFILSPMRKFFITAFIIFLICNVYAQSSIDVLHYKFQLEVKDETDVISGQAEIQLKVLHPVREISFDLIQLGSNGKGMTVSAVTGDQVQQYRQENNKVIVSLKNPMVDQIQSVQINYS